jgi:multiple sugar transport system substrate-binding protein
LNSTECVNALTFIKKLYDEDIEAGAWKAGAVDPDMGFLNGKYAMVFNGPWKIKSLLDANFPFGIFLIPKGSFGRPTPIGGTDMVIFRNSKNYKNAIKFLQYLTSKEVQTMWANELGEIPVNKMSMNEIDFGKHPYLKVFVEGIKEAVPRPPFPDYQGVENIVNPEIEAALTGKKEIKKALDDATMRVNKEILSIQ